MSNPSTTYVAETVARRQVGRSIWAIVGGFLAVVILSNGTDEVLRRLGIFPPLGQRMADRLFVWATIYRTIYAIFGSYLTARWAPDRPLWHAMVGAGIGMLLGTAFAVATWNLDLGPHWYSVAVVLVGIPCAWSGAKIRELQRK